MSYNKDGWAEECVTLETSGPRDCKVETAGPMYHIQWRWLGRGTVQSGDGWADAPYTMEMGGLRNVVH